jgi:Protein of unknown function (DUF1254)
VSAGWDALAKAAAEARTLVAEQAPDAEVAAEGEAYVARVMAAGLGGAVLGHLFSRDGLSSALPCYGGPNPDYIMRFSPVSPSGSYRLEGRLNGSERVGVGLYSYGPTGAPLATGYAAFEAANCAADGSFWIDLGDGAPARGGLAIEAGTQVMLVRVLHRDPDSEPASLRFTGAPPQGGLALATGSADGALSFVARSLANNVREYLKWTGAARTLANRLDVAPPELTATVQGDADTRYFLGGFDLADGEWLEVTIPRQGPGYWSLHAYNFWYEHLQTPGVHDRNAKAGVDGSTRIAVGPVLPADLANRIDTRGRKRGAFVCRMISEGGPPQTAVRSGTEAG